MPRRGGPYPHLRLNVVTKVEQGAAVARLVAQGTSLRQAAGMLGLSRMTAWRRYWWLLDWSQPTRYGLPAGPIPPQRSTRACPRGRPYLPTYDGRRRP